MTCTKHLLRIDPKCTKMHNRLSKTRPTYLYLGLPGRLAGHLCKKAGHITFLKILCRSFTTTIFLNQFIKNIYQNSFLNCNKITRKFSKSEFIITSRHPRASIIT